MNTFEKIGKTLTDNITYTILALCAIALFAIFSDGLLNGIVTAVSALVIYVSVNLLIKEYKKINSKKKK